MRIKITKINESDAFYEDQVMVGMTGEFDLDTEWDAGGCCGDFVADDTPENRKIVENINYHDKSLRLTFHSINYDEI